MSIVQTWGSTQAEREMAFPCDGLIPGADALYRGIDVDAPAAVTFRWLCQLRAAPYSYDWIDNFGRQSPLALIPGLEKLEAGQPVMRLFELVCFESDRHLTIRLHRPGGLFGDVAVSYVVAPRAVQRSRIVVKLLWRYPVAPIVGRLAGMLLPWGDLVMMRKQLLTLKSLAERDAARRPTAMA